VAEDYPKPGGFWQIGSGDFWQDLNRKTVIHQWFVLHFQTNPDMLFQFLQNGFCIKKFIICFRWFINDQKNIEVSWNDDQEIQYVWVCLKRESAWQLIMRICHVDMM